MLKCYIECRYFDQDGTLCDPGTHTSPSSNNAIPSAISPVVSTTSSSSPSSMGQKRSQESLHRAKSGASHSQILSSSPSQVLNSQEQTSFMTPTAITPRFGTQPMPVSSVSAAASQSEPYQRTTEVDDLGTLLDLPDLALQDEINAILRDPRFDLLVQSKSQCFWLLGCRQGSSPYTFSHS